MKRTSVRVFLLIVLCLALSTARKARTVVAAPAIQTVAADTAVADNGEPTFVIDDNRVPITGLTGNCEYFCGGDRCPELTGYCKGLVGNVCRRATDLRNCPRGWPAIRLGRNACGYGVDLARRCKP